MSESNVPMNPYVHLRGCPPEKWLRRTKSLRVPSDPEFIDWPATEDKIRVVARQNGMLLERLPGDEGYRLWDMNDAFDNCVGLFPVDLTGNGEYVDFLLGIAVWLWEVFH